MKGRKPVPTNLVMLRGNPSKKAINKHEPRHATGAPSKPQDVSDAESRYWDEYVGELTACGTLARVEGGLLKAFCSARAWSDYWNEQVRGAPGDRGAHAELRAYLLLVNKLGAELGLSPSSRTRVVALAPPTKRDEFFG